MAVRFLNQLPEGKYSYSPNTEWDFTEFNKSLSGLVNQAMQSQQIQQDRAILRKILGQEAEGIMGQEQPPPTTLSGRVMQGMGQMFGVGRENQPISEIQKAVIEAKMRQMGQLSIEDKIRLEEAKAGIKTKIEKQKSLTKTLENYKKMADAEGWQLNLDKTQPLEKQLQTARQLFVMKKGEKKTEKESKKITPTAALNILLDPFESQKLKRQYPALYAEVEKIVKDTFGENVLNKDITQKTGNLMDTNW